MLFGSAFWGGLTRWVKEQLLATGKIHAHDRALLWVTDDTEEVVEIMLASYRKNHDEAAPAPAINRDMR